MAASPNPIASPTKNGASLVPFFSRPKFRRWFTLILILWLTLFLRVWQLDVLPPGLHYDEAFNGSMARDVVRGVNRPIFFTSNFGEEPLHLYTEALFFSFLPESPWTIRLVSAFMGVILVASVYACARAFFPNSDVLALSSAFIAATLYWAINFSRIGIETNSLPFLVALSAAALAHAYRKMSWGWILGAGFLIGAAIYTYLASRVWPVAVFLWFLYLVIFHFRHVHAHFPKWVAIGFVALLTLAPLILFFVQNPVAFTGRSGTVFTPETFLTNLLRTMGMFFFSGDTDPRDNLIGRPALDIVLSIFLTLGLALSLLRFRKPFYGFLVIWFVIMCLPSALTEFAPNFRRAIGALPATILFCAIGFDYLWFRLAKLSPLASRLSFPNQSKQPSDQQSNNPTTQQPNLYPASTRGDRTTQPLSRKHSRGPDHPTRLQSPVSSLPTHLLRSLLLVTLLLSAFWSARAYFVEWANSSGLFYSFDAGLLAIGETLAARPAGERLYLTPDYDEHYTIRWALDGRPLSSFDGRRIEVLPDSSRAATYGIITREDSVTAEHLKSDDVGLTEIQGFSDAAGAPYAVLLHQSAGRASSAPTDSVRFGDFAVLLPQSGTAPFKRGEIYDVELTWQVLRPASNAYTVFAQLVGPPNPATGSIVWAQADKQPGAGTYPTDAWQSGEKIIEHYALKVPPEALAGSYKILVGMYLLETNERVPLYSETNAPVPDNALEVNTFELP